MAVRVRRYFRRDGTPVRSHARRSRRTAGVVAISIALTFAIASNSGGVASSFARAGEFRTPRIEIQAKAKVKFKRTKERFRAREFHVDLHMSFDTNCGRHSYGKVHHFFLSNPCVLLARAYLVLRGKSKNVILVAISSATMPNVYLAYKYKNLVDLFGTGNITELSRDSGPYRSVRFTGKRYISGLDETTVWNAQVEPVLSPDLALLGKILTEAQQ